MEVSRDGVSVSGSMVGKRTEDGVTLTAGTAEVQTMSKVSTVSGGTFTVSFMGETTSALAYNIINSALLTALEALPNIAPGDVTLGGGPINTTPVTITFAGQYASADVPLMIVDSALLTGGGSYSIAQTTPGAPLAQSTLQPMSGNEWDFYVDTTAAGLGTTKLTRCFGGSWDLSDLYAPFWVGNTTETSWASFTDQKTEPSIEFTLAADSTGNAYFTQLRNGAKLFPRLKLTGPTLGASTYLAQFDFATILTDPGSKDDEQGVTARTWGGSIVYDATWGKWCRFLVRNGLATLT
jgi:hypothetical protein